MYEEDGNSKTCNALTKKGVKCTRTPHIFWYCKQHWKLRIFSWWGLFWATVVSGGVLLTYYSSGKEVAIDIKTATEPEPDSWYCDEDGKRRGQSFTGSYIKDPKNVILWLGNSSRAFPLIELKKDRIVEINPFSHYYFDPDFTDFKHSGAFGFKLSEDNKLLIYLDIYDWDGRRLGEMRSGKFMLNVGCELTWNFDGTAFEVLDSEMEVLMNVQCLKDDVIVVNGLFHNAGNFFFYANKTQVLMHGKDFLKNQGLFRKKIPRIFEYHGKDWFGKRKSLN